MNSPSLNTPKSIGEAVAAEAARTRVLLIEDSPIDARLIRAMLSNARNKGFELEHTDRLATGVARLALGGIHIVLLDLSLPDSAGLTTFQKIRAAAPRVPVIVMSGLDDETVAVNAVHEGAQDYLVKGEVTGQVLVRCIRYAIERRRAMEALRQSDAFYQSLVESLPQLILRKDLHGRFTFGNKRFLTELGLKLEDLTGKTDFDFFPPELARKYQADDHEVIASGRIFETVEEHTPPGQGKRYVQVVKTPIYSFEGKPIGTQGIFWDVTERKLAEERIKQANVDLAKGREELLKALDDLQRSHGELKETQLQLIQMEKLQLVGRLAAGVAHEVKNPLAVLRMGLDFLANNPVVANNAAPVLKDMVDAIRRADAIILGLLDFSVPGQLELHGEDVNTLLDDSLRLVRHELSSASIQYQRDFGSALPLVQVDRNKIKQVFVNLLTNAAHAMPKGGTLTVRTRVKINATDENKSDAGVRETALLHTGDQAVIVEIEDTGTGIPADILARIFDPFFTTKATGKGTGLGLTVTKKIIELHGGALEIRNRESGGVRSSVRLQTWRKTHE